MVEGLQSPVFVARAVVVPITKLVPVRLINIDLTSVAVYTGTSWQMQRLLMKETLTL